MTKHILKLCLKSRFLKYVWSFFSIMYERVKLFRSNVPIYFNDFKSNAANVTNDVEYWKALKSMGTLARKGLNL